MTREVNTCAAVRDDEPASAVAARWPAARRGAIKEAF